MPAFYLDASAIAKMYLPGEQGTNLVVELLGQRSQEDSFFTSTLSVVEVKSAISRRISNAGTRSSLLDTYDRDVQVTFSLIAVSYEVIIGAGTVVENYRLRAGDAIHLATALEIVAAGVSQVFMITSDSELLDASEAAGIGALDPQVDDAMDSLLQIRE